MVSLNSSSNNISRNQRNKNKNTTYIFTNLSLKYLHYDLQVNVDVTQIFTDNILTILP